MNSILKYLPCLLVVACTSPEFEVIEDGQEDTLPITIHSEINQVHTRRVEDGGFADGDAIGVYIVNYENGQSADLSSSDNHATNVKFTFDEEGYSWNPERPVYWQDKVTPVDAYGYYPYRDEISDVHSMPFIICSNQAETDEESGLGGYEASDFLWAKASGVSPSTGMIRLDHNHMMASVQVTLVPGEGFTAEEWAALDKTVMVENTRLVSYVDLSDGNVTVDDEAAPQSIVAVKDGEDWRAIVVPQVVAQGKSLISITINGYSYYLTRDDMMTYHQGKMHKFTIEVQNSIPTGDYQFNLMDEAVTVWESDLISHGDVVKEYQVVYVPEYGSLAESMELLEYDLKLIKNLKIIGKINYSDCKYIQNNMPYIEAINAYDATFQYDKIPSMAFTQLSCLKTFVFPRYIKTIGDYAFIETSLSGDLILPEGLERIEASAFRNAGWAGGANGYDWQQIHNNLIGELKLPSTLKFIGEDAFYDCKFTGRLHLPEDLEYIGPDAFSGCSRFTGRLVLPEGVTEICGGSFDGTKGLSGELVIPDGVTIIGGYAFRNSGISSVKFPESLKIIEKDSGLGYEGGAFEGSSLKGEVVLPNALSYLGGGTFKKTNITAVILPEKLPYLEPRTFEYCSELQDTIVIPSNMAYIGERCFAGCEKLNAIIISDGVEEIKDRAFENCFSLGYIYSLALVPPVMNNISPFNGVPKDNFTIEVPEDAVETYRSAPYWNEFKRISSYRGFVCRPSKANVLNGGGTREIILNADSQWTMISCPDWCHISEVTGNKKTAITLTIDPMHHDQGNRTGRIEFKLDDSDEHYTHITVGQYDYEYEEDEAVLLQKSSKGNGIDIFIVGDGYDALDISSGLYLEDMRQEMEYFFSVEPYKTYREYFDVHTAIALSNESGIGTLNTLRDVKFDTMYGDFENERINGNAEAVVEYAVQTVDDITSENIHRLTAIVIPNSDGYDGVTNMWTNGTAVAVCPKSSAEYPLDARGVIQHEAGGHAFGKLGDEYIYHQDFIQTCDCFCCDHIDGILDAQSRGWYRNLSLSGKYKDVEWSHLIYDLNYTDIVDVYEGGYFHSRGVYRSEYNSCMNDNDPYFSTISRQAIVERIKEYAGEEFSFDDFVANDSREWGIDFTDPTQTRSVAEPRSSVNVHRHQPIIIEGSPLD